MLIRRIQNYMIEDVRSQGGIEHTVGPWSVFIKRIQHSV